MLTAKARTDLRPFWALWIVARDMTTNAPVPAGYWTGGYDATITVGGVARPYWGAGAFLTLEPLTYQLGAVVQTQRVSLGPLAQEVRTRLRGYDTKQAAVDLQLVMLDANDAVTQVEEAFTGVMDVFDINDGPIDDAGNMTVTCDVELVSDARQLTRTLSLKMSDASQRRRDAADAFRKYADVAGTVAVNWMGETDNPHYVGRAPSVFSEIRRRVRLRK